MDFFSAAREATENMLHDPEYWRSLGKPMPPQFLGFTIPESIRRDTDRDQEPHDEHNRQA